MEKCTYCVQRIQAVKIHAKNEQRARSPTARSSPPASRRARPRRSSSATSAIRRARCARPRTPARYAPAGELNTRPRTTYLAQIRNPESRAMSRRMSTIALPLDDNTWQRSAPRLRRWCSGRADRGHDHRHTCAGDRRAPRARRRRGTWPLRLLRVSTVIFFLLIGYLIATGVGVWGNNRPVCWAFDITNFVFWIGIGHAGTLISAILFLLAPEVAHQHQPRGRGDDALRRGLRRNLPGHPRRAGSGWCIGWRPTPIRCRSGPTSAARCCGTCSRSPPTSPFPRVLVPGHDSRPGHAARPGHQPRCGSSSTASSPWAGGARTGTGTYYEMAYLILAGSATPLVLSRALGGELRLRHLGGSRLAHHDLSALLRGGGHLRRIRHGDYADGARPGVVSGLKDLITMQHMDNMSKIILLDRLHGRLRLRDRILHRLVQRQRIRAVRFRQPAFGPYAWAYWIMVSCNVLAPQFFWFKRWRHHSLADVHRGDLGERGNVVRAVCDHRDLA